MRNFQFQCKYKFLYNALATLAMNPLNDAGVCTVKSGIVYDGIGIAYGTMMLFSTCVTIGRSEFSHSKLTVLTRNTLFNQKLETHFCYSKLTFSTRTSLLLLETHFFNSKLTTRKKKKTPRFRPGCNRVR